MLLLDPDTVFEADRLPLEPIQDADIARILGEWQHLRGSRAMPARRDFRIEELRYCLGRINLLEVQQDPPDFVYRVRGTTIAQLHRNDMTGQSVTEMQPPAYRDMLIRHYQECVALRGPLLYRIRQSKDSFSNAYRRILLPLSEDGDTVHMLLSVSSWGPDFTRGAPILGFR